MAAPTAAIGFRVSTGAPPPALSGLKGRRRITPEAGRALEILSHAIEYLTDEYVNRAESLSANDPEVKAIQLLMALNRQTYFECPVMPTLAERCRALFAPRHA